MNKKLYLLLIFPLLFSFMRQQEDLISWNAKRPLRSEDFKVVQKDTIKIANSGGRFKGAQSELFYDYQILPDNFNAPEVKIKVYFDKNNSWILFNDERTLEHEQIHFNIDELFARKMRKSIDSLKILNIKNINIYINILENYSNKNKIYSSLFDQEIDDKIFFLNGKFLSHKDKGQQKVWKEKVYKELKALDKYKLN